MVVNIKIKWNKQTFDQVVIDPSQGVAVLKKQIWDLTGVPTDRQKLMAKGAWIGVLKDEADLSTCKIQEGLQVMLMGTADVLVVNKEVVTFIEDMTVDQLAEKGAIMPAGMVNMGNTCYMNSTVQCFRHMSELRKALVPVQIPSLSSFLRTTCDDLDRSGKSIPPVAFVHHLRTNFPQFAENQQGRYMQQDAEEFYNTLISVLQADVRAPNSFSSLLGLQLEETLTCQETDQEASITKLENVNKLVCNIQGSLGSTAIDHLYDGVKLGFEGSVEKFSAVLNRDALWKKKQRISTLPRYICFQFMRFFWKATPESRDHQGVKCKIMRAVTFPETIDMYDLVNDPLQKKLRVNREAAEKAFEASLAAKRAKLDDNGSASSSTSSSSSSSTSSSASASAGSSSDAAPMDTSDSTVGPAVDENDEESAALHAAMQMSMGQINGAPSTGEFIGEGLPANFTGLYELHGIVTHKGRSADSGHYIGWVRQEPGSEYWWCYDDDKVTEVTTDVIMLLKGGGDRDTAYLNFYRFKDGSKDMK
jgi:ubiquitin carboxyl-terminal hydrolase 14